MPYMDLGRIPEDILVEYQDTLPRFEEPGNRRAGEGVRFLKRTEGMEIVLDPAPQPIKRVRLRWNGDLSDVKLVLGDAWERSGDMVWTVPVAHKAMPWYFHTFDGKLLNSYGVMTGCNAMCFWQMDAHGIALWLDVRCGGDGVILRESLPLATVLARKGIPEETPFAAARAFCRAMCPAPVLPQGAIFGTNNWYWAYGEFTREQVLRDAAYTRDLAARAGQAPYAVIDDGWQAIRYKTASSYYNGGPWYADSPCLGDMAEMASAMAQLGVEPGLWYRPFLTVEKRAAGVPQLQRPCEGEMPGVRLDPTHPDALAMIEEDAHCIACWGFKLIKHDFSTADLVGDFTRQEGWHFWDRSQTTAQVVKTLYRTIQAAAGNALVIGCNTFNHLAAGIHAIQRSGDDTSGRSWEWTRRFGCNALMRLPQNNAFFRVDPDCAAFTEKVPADMNLLFLEACALSGSVTLASIAPGVLTVAQEREVQRIFAICARNDSFAEPLDWMQTSAPEHFRDVRGKEYRFDWYKPYQGSRTYLNWFV